MTERAVDIEAVVREVMRRLATARPDGVAGDDADNNEELALTERVVSLAQVEGRLEGVRRVRARPGAVVTPAVRDLLARNKIRLTVADSSQTKTNKGAAAELVVGLVETTFDPAALELAIAPGQVEILARSGLGSVVEELASHVGKGGRWGMLFTPRCAAALCMANRFRGVRAVQAASVAEVVTGLAEVGANLLVVDPAGRSTFELKKIVGRFRSGGPRICPEPLRGSLE